MQAASVPPTGAGAGAGAGDGVDVGAGGQSVSPFAATSSAASSSPESPGVDGAFLVLARMSNNIASVIL
jgi:hypothetical protein